MRILQTVNTPDKVVIIKYTPGLVIDCSEPAPSTDLESIRRSTNMAQWAGSDDDSLIHRTNALLKHLGLAQRAADFEKSLTMFTGCEEFSLALERTLSALCPGKPIPCDTVERLGLLFKRTGILDRAPHLPSRMYCHIPGEITSLPADGTHFGYVLDGQANELQTSDGRRYPLCARSYFSISGSVQLFGEGKIAVITRLGYSGLFTVGSSIPEWGTLKYIDGCTDTPLIQPPRRGDPCLNALYFPPATRQTRHYHPSIRAGIVVQGEGTCVTPDGKFPLISDHIFLIPPETWHFFVTPDVKIAGRSAMTITTYHPDSDFGPTDEDHPMTNRTYCGYLERLRSAARTS